MKQALIFLLLFGFVSVKAQTYKYITPEDGLSDRRVHYIQKDKRRYMWFLTHEGIDRYNGTEFKQYPLTENGRTLKTNQHLGWLYVD
jgi:ligand-binding sensor domain-containing protein